MPRLISILVPVYNEQAHLRTSMERVLSAPLPDGVHSEIILVDDASTDGSTELVRVLATEHPDRIRAFFQAENQGKGAALRRAIAEIQGDFALIQDADLEYDPGDYPVLLQPLVEGTADVVYGSRFKGRSPRDVSAAYHVFGNRLLTWLSNLCTGLRLTDMETCYKAFRSEILKSIPLRSNRFGIEPEITAKIARRKAVVTEVPIRYQSRSYSEGKKIGWKDGFSAMYTILRYRILDDSSLPAVPSPVPRL